LREVVTNIYDEKASTLSHIIHTISVRYILVKHENEQLREALETKKKRRQRSRPLQLEELEDDNRGAI